MFIFRLKSTARVKLRQPGLVPGPQSPALINLGKKQTFKASFHYSSQF